MGDPEATIQHSAVPPVEEKTQIAAPVIPQPGEDAKTSDAADAGTTFVEDDDDLDAESPSDSDEIRSIDATLARFSAVHDQIAVEEAERRKRYSWLLGKRKEPELGRDMPFDFREGRDSKASRLEWKKQQRKRRISLLVKALAVVAALTIVVVVGVSWSA